jgi:flagellar biogenesis protein FliO
MRRKKILQDNILKMMEAIAIFLAILFAVLYLVVRFVDKPTEGFAKTIMLDHLWPDCTAST